MRELKFRVWSEEDREYRTDLSVFRLVEGKVFCTSPSYSLEGDRFDVEQYTGLKDKNGKEIYEGDVVKASGTLKTSGFGVGAIEMVQQQFIIMDAPTYDDPKLGRTEWLGGYAEQQLEVIGNIHENPELLEDNQ